MLKFKKDFQFGASTSALQTEGQGTTKIGKLTFDQYFDESPELFYDRIGPSLTSDVMNHYLDDIKMYQEIGLDSMRTGFSWARLFPDGETINLEAVKYYHDFLQAVKKAKIKIFMTLFHFDMPLWAHEKGGWASTEVINAFVKYAEFVFLEYQNEVDYFVTFNEPLVPVFGGYLEKSHYPAINNPKMAVEQAYGIFLANAKAIEKYRELNLSVPIGVVYDWNYTFPLTDKSEDIQAARIYDAYVNRGPLKIMSIGSIDEVLIETLKADNLLPNYSANDLETIKKVKVDFLGINYYFPTRIQAIEPVNNNRWVLDRMEMVIPKTARINPFRNWEIYPEGLYDISIAITKELNNLPWYVAENGIGVENEGRFRGEDGLINDQYRIEYVKEHLMQIEKGITAGTNCFGYHMWALLDCWSFRNAYKNRYGLIEVNLEDQSRKFKQSAFWYQQLIKSKIDEENYEK